MGLVGRGPVDSGQPRDRIAVGCNPARCEPMPMRPITTTSVTDSLHSTEFKFSVAIADLQLGEMDDGELNATSRRQWVGNPRRTANMDRDNSAAFIHDGKR